MFLYKKLFQKKEKSNLQNTEQIINIIQQQQLSFQQKARCKERNDPISLNELMQIFSEYFAPNTEFYSVPGSAKSTAYFMVVNAARNEIVQNPSLFHAATKWTPAQLAEWVSNPIPGVTNSLICALIFTMGSYAVIRDVVYCVDFCEAIPNCIALFLLLTAQKLPSEKRKMLIDAGDGSNAKALIHAMNTLSVCDPSWRFTVA